MQFTLSDPVGKTISLNLQPKDLLVSGEKLNKDKDDCYLVVFPHQNSQHNGIILGNIVLQNYLTVYDASPIDDNRNYVQIGIAISAQTSKVRTQLMIEYEEKRDIWEMMKRAEDIKEERAEQKEQEEAETG